MSFIRLNNRNVYYRQTGAGETILIVHGNSVSSKMHLELEKVLADDFQVISIDLSGHGESDRIDTGPVDFWYVNALTVVELISELKLPSAVLLGYSGGAQIVLNAALEYPNLVTKVIADSFEGDKSVAAYAECIFEAREEDKKILSP